MNYLDYYFSKDLDYNSLDAASKVPVGTPPNAGNKTTPANRVYPSGTLTRKDEGGGGDTGEGGPGGAAGEGSGGHGGGGTGGGGTGGGPGDEGGPGAAAAGGSGGHGGGMGGPGSGPGQGGGDPNPPGGGGTGTGPGTTVMPAPNDTYGVNLDPNLKPGAEVSEFTKFLKEIGADQYSFWKENYKPLEQQQIAETKRFMTPEYANQQAAQAGADVTGAFAGKRAATEADLQSMGLGDPSQGRYQAYRRGLDIAEAGTLASAKTGARLNAERTGYAALSGLVNQGNVKTAAAAGAGQAAGGMAATAAGLNQRQNEFANTFNQRNFEFGKTQELDRWKTNEASDAAESAGFGQLVGTVGTVAALALSSKQYKTQKKRYKGGLDALDKMPVEQWKYKKGIADEGHHIGPYAEDFQKATGKGDGKTIAHQDAIGVTMAAVKELHGRVKQLEGNRKLRRTSDPSSEMNQPEGAEA